MFQPARTILELLTKRSTTHRRDDNSCLFSAIATVFEGGIEKAQEMRKSKLPLDATSSRERRGADAQSVHPGSRTVVARAIEADPETYSELFLE